MTNTNQGSNGTPPGKALRVRIDVNIYQPKTRARPTGRYVYDKRLSKPINRALDQLAERKPMTKAQLMEVVEGIRGMVGGL